MTGPSPAAQGSIRVLLHLRRPAEFGLESRVHAVHLTLRDGFARSADQARRKILDLVRRGQSFDLAVHEQADPVTVAPELVELVAAWKGAG